MNRRDFLKYSLYTTMMTGGAAGLGLRAANAVTAYGRTLVNVMLPGGADFRFLFAPEPGTPYAERYWEARASLYQNNAANTALYPSYDAAWTGLYAQTTDNASGDAFGIHNNAAWLREQFNLGNVAIVANVLGSENRRHDHSQLIVNTGDPGASQFIFDRDGWGGRLAYAIDAANAVAVTRGVSIFCNGIEPANRNARVIHARDTRNFSFSTGDLELTSDNSVMARTLSAYYAQKQVEARAQPANWPYRKFLQHEESVRTFGTLFDARLAEAAPQRPPALTALYTAGSGNNLNDPYFGEQCGNVYDSFVGADVFRQRVVSMEYVNWDTHFDEMARFSGNIEDIFGAGRGLDTLTQSLDIGPPGANDDTVYVFTTDFGRQLRANGGFGTDHGRGNYMIIIGRGVSGGIYGEMFPESEITGGAGQTPYDIRGSDIEGLTAFESVLSTVCDWVEPGTGAQVFPGTAAGNTLPLEPGVDLSLLFSV